MTNFSAVCYFKDQGCRLYCLQKCNIVKLLLIITLAHISTLLSNFIISRSYTHHLTHLFIGVKRSKVRSHFCSIVFKLGIKP